MVNGVRKYTATIVTTDTSQLLPTFLNTNRGLPGDRCRRCSVRGGSTCRATPMRGESPARALRARHRCGGGSAQQFRRFADRGELERRQPRQSLDILFDRCVEPLDIRRSWGEGAEAGYEAGGVTTHVQLAHAMIQEAR